MGSKYAALLSHECKVCLEGRRLARVHTPPLWWSMSHLTSWAFDLWQDELCYSVNLLIWHTTQLESSHSPPPQREILQCYLGQAQRVMTESLFVLLQLSRHHLPRPEVETSQVHCVSKVTGQLRLTPELLPWRTEGKEEGDKEGRKEGRQIADFFLITKKHFLLFRIIKKKHFYCVLCL